MVGRPLVILYERRRRLCKIFSLCKIETALVQHRDLRMLGAYPVNTAHLLRRWPNIKLALVQCAARRVVTEWSVL